MMASGQDVAPVPPVIAFYGGRETFRAIDGAATPEEVRQAIEEAVLAVARKTGTQGASA